MTHEEEQHIHIPRAMYELPRMPLLSITESVHELCDGAQFSRSWEPGEAMIFFSLV